MLGAGGFPGLISRKAPRILKTNLVSICSSMRARLSARRIYFLAVCIVQLRCSLTHGLNLPWTTSFFLIAIRWPPASSASLRTASLPALTSTSFELIYPGSHTTCRTDRMGGWVSVFRRIWWDAVRGDGIVIVGIVRYIDHWKALQHGAGASQAPVVWFRNRSAAGFLSRGPRRFR